MKRSLALLVLLAVVLVVPDPLAALGSLASRSAYTDAVKAASTTPSASRAPHHPPPGPANRQGESSRDVRLISVRGDVHRFDQAIDLLLTRDEPTESRMLILADLASNKRELDGTDQSALILACFHLAQDPDEDPRLASTAVRLLASLIDLVKEREQTLCLDRARVVRFLRSAARDEGRPIPVRSSAIQALGLIGSAEDVIVLEALAADPRNWHVADLARPLCLALLRLKDERALDDILCIFRQTEDLSTFKTAACCLSRIKHPDSLSALVLNADRFGDPSILGFALAAQSDIICTILRDSEHPAILEAIDATRHLYRTDHRDRYLPLLCQLLSAPQVNVRRTSARRLLEIGYSLPPTAAANHLRHVLPLFQRHDDLEDYADRVHRCLEAAPLVLGTRSLPLQYGFRPNWRIRQRGGSGVRRCRL